MRSFNKVMLHGRLTADPEMHQAKNGGAPVATFSLATNRDWTTKDGEKVGKTDFHRIVAFGKLGEIVGTYLKKGRPVIIAGRLNNSSYTGEDGKKKYSTEVVLEDFNFLPSGKKKEEAVAA